MRIILTTLRLDVPMSLGEQGGSFSTVTFISAQVLLLNV